MVDQQNYTIRRITAAGVVSTIAGLADAQGINDGINGAARFYSPRNIATDRSGNIFVTDSYYYIVRKISPVGTNWMVTTIAGQLGSAGYRDGTNNGARFNGPGGLAVDSAGTIYVADGPIRKITHIGNNWVVSTVANSVGYVIIQNNSGPNTTNAVGLFTGSATAIATDGAGNLFVTDQSAHTVSKLTLMGTNWVSSIIAGLSGSAGSTDGLGSAARFQSPSGIAADALGNLYVTDGSGGDTVRALTPQGTNWLVTTLAGSPGNSGDTDGVGTNALFNGLFGVAVDGANNLMVTDSGNNKVRKVTSAGVVRTIAGYTAVSSGSVDNVGNDARFNSPAGVAVDIAGNTYVADQGNSTIRMVTPAGIVSTLAGSVLSTGTNDGVGSNARFNYPEGIAVDQTGNVFVADGSHNDSHDYPRRHCQHNCGKAGMPGYVDGPGQTAQFSGTSDVAVDSAGNLFVADTETPGSGSSRALEPTGW